MMRLFRRSLVLLGRCQRGATAMIYGVALVPLCATAGLAIDWSTARAADQAVADATDAAILAAAKTMQKNAADVTAITNAAKRFFAEDIASANSNITCEDPIIITNTTNFEVSMDVKCTLPTTFTSLVGLNKWTLKSDAKAVSTPSKLDIALMLDVSGSMSGKRLTDLKVASHEAINILVAETGMGSGETRVAFAPYASSVNLGTYGPAAVGPDYDSDRSQPDCVSERKGSAKKKSDMPAPGKYVGYDATECPTASITPLTANATTLHAQIDALTAGGNTAGQVGIAWSWYLITPEWRAFWPDGSKPREADDAGVLRAVVLMTDGEFNQTYDSTQGNSINQAKSMCKRMRDDGIIIYAVAFQAPLGGKSVLKDCASSDDLFFEPQTGEELSEAYSQIASTLSQLRLTE